MENFAKETLPISLEEEMRRSYLDYAMSVIVGRALPDVRGSSRCSVRASRKARAGGPASGHRERREAHALRSRSSRNRDTNGAFPPLGRLAESLWRIDPLSVSFTCEGDGKTAPSRKHCRRNASRDSNMPVIRARPSHVYLLASARQRRQSSVQMPHIRAGQARLMRGAISRSAMTGGTLRAIGSVAHAPQLEGVLIGGGFFYRRKGTIWQNANAQRVRHCSKSTHNVFCLAPMLYFEQCM